MARLPSARGPRYVMAMSANPRSKILLGAAAIAAVALAVIVLGDGFRGAPPPADQAGDGAGAAGEEAAAAPAVRTPRPDLARTGGAGADDPALMTEAAAAGEAGNEHPVDLARLRAMIPDNVYWQLGAPTDDPQVLRSREEDEQRWNDLYGKVLSGTATEEEVRRYYEHRRQVSEDYIELASLVIEEYGEQLPEHERGLYELSIEMHTTRLAEIPRKIEDALARKQDQDRRREEWRRRQGE